MLNEIAIAGRSQGPPYFDEFKIKFWCQSESPSLDLRNKCNYHVK